MESVAPQPNIDAATYDRYISTLRPGWDEVSQKSSHVPVDNSRSLGSRRSPPLPHSTVRIQVDLQGHSTIIRTGFASVKGAYLASSGWRRNTTWATPARCPKIEPTSQNLQQEESFSCYNAQWGVLACSIAPFTTLGMRGRIELGQNRFKQHDLPPRILQGIPATHRNLEHTQPETPLPQPIRNVSKVASADLSCGRG